jgi:hypothetical protein
LFITAIGPELKKAKPLLAFKAIVVAIKSYALSGSLYFSKLLVTTSKCFLITANLLKSNLWV